LPESNSLIDAVSDYAYNLHQLNLINNIFGEIKMKSAVLNVHSLSANNDEIPVSLKVLMTTELKARIQSLSHVLKAMKGSSIIVNLDSDGFDYVFTDLDLNLDDGLGGAPHTITSSNTKLESAYLEVRQNNFRFTAFEKNCSDEFQIRTSFVPMEALSEDVECYIQ
jgi:hypothetical protein